MREGLTGAARMLADILDRHVHILRAATSDADLLAFTSRAFGTCYGGYCDRRGWADYKGTMPSAPIRAPEYRYSADKGETYTTYRGKALASLVRSILGTEPQADLFAGARAAAPERVA